MEVSRTCVHILSISLRYSALYLDSPLIKVYCSNWGFISDPRNSGGFNVNRGNGRKPSLGNQNIPLQKKQSADCFNASPKENKGEQQKKQEAVIKKQTTVAKPTKPSGGESGPGRPTKPALEQKLKVNEMNFQQKSDKGTIQKRPVASQQNVSILKKVIF